MSTKLKDLHYYIVELSMIHTLSIVRYLHQEGEYCWYKNHFSQIDGPYSTLEELKADNFEEFL